MTDRYRLHKATRIALLQGEGALTLEDWQDAALELLAGKSDGGTWRILSDRRRMGATYPAWMEDRFLAFVREYAHELGEVRWAVVVHEDTPAIETVRLAEKLTQGTRVQVQAFTDLTEALKWILGVYENDQITELIRWVDQSESRS